MSAKKLIIDLYRISRKKYYGTVIPLVSFEELSVRFQHPDIMILRQYGLLHLSASPLGVQIDRNLFDLSSSEFLNYIKIFNL